MMPDDEMSPSANFGQSLERIAEGGLLRLIASKPLQQAIGRLIYGVVDVPVAKLEQWAQAIRSDTAARKQVTSAVATKARAQALGDPTLIDRAVDRWTTKLGSDRRLGRT